MKLKFLQTFDYLLLICVLVLCTMSVIFLYSAGMDSNGILTSSAYSRQLIWVGIGIAIMIFFALFDYRRIERHALVAYIIICFVLLLTLLFTKARKGASSWIRIGSLGGQPSELGKIIFILFFARYLKRSQKESPLNRYIKALCFFSIPTGLILLQPDLGTASVYIPIFLFMCFVAGIPLRYILFFLFMGLFTVVLTVLPAWQSMILHKSISLINILVSKKLLLLILFCSVIITIIGTLGNIFFKKQYYYWITYVFALLSLSLFFSMPAAKVLKKYQMERLVIFLNPYSDPEGAGYNIIQSLTAIGSGGFWGQGFLKGIQSHIKGIPEQKTDFIFSIIAEESGFVGCMILFAAFFIILVRIISVIHSTTNNYGYYISSGILAMFFFHFAVNIGMGMGVMPITGIPLPFLSYGGSAMITNMAAIGLLMSISSRRLDFSVAVL